LFTQDASPNAPTFIHKGLIPNENSVFDEKAWEKKTKGPRLDKKPVGKKLANGNEIIDFWLS
jgi:hypothetical protein